MDDAIAIPGTNLRIGWDAILGFLVPGAGDALTGLSHVALLVYAFRRRLPKVVLVRMVLNAGLDLLTGAVPVLGDLFDMAFKANRRNLDLLERAESSGVRSATRGDYLFVGGAIASVLLIMLIPLFLAAALVAWLGRHLF